jgi:PBP1b-binding outer membrane lipoprotein LpoB
MIMKKTCLMVILGAFLLSGCAVSSSGYHKSTICHKGKTLEVADQAVDAHLKHGDYYGPCR